MPRYFLELSYKGTNYSGFQVQENAKTIQSEVENALQTLYRQSFGLTGSSRTDAGVHAFQNYFHFDSDIELHQKEVYNLNAILPSDIAVTAYYKAASDDAHSRFGAISREYKYFIYNKKNPFLYDRGWYYPFKIDTDLLHQTAQFINKQQNFLSFSKRNTQVNNFDCSILQSKWQTEKESLVFNVTANRFLRGMVRALVSSMLKVARGSMDMAGFEGLFLDPVQSAADFSAPARGLFLVQVNYPTGYFQLVK